MNYWKLKIMYISYLQIAVRWTLVIAAVMCLFAGLAGVVVVIDKASAAEIKVTQIEADREELLSVLNGKMVMVDDMRDGFAVVTSVKDELVEMAK